MTIPDFFIVGAPRCGTTAINHYLKQHPAIFMAQKESHFFAHDHVAPYVVQNESVYRALFSGARPDQCVGEASVNYLYSKAAAENIKRFNPVAKIIIMLRNPVDMLHSLYHHYLYTGAEDIIGFEAALEADEVRRSESGLRGIRCFSGEYLSYKDMVRFASYVRKYINVFGPDRVHVVILERMKLDPVSTYQEVLEFLGVRAVEFPMRFEVVNRNRNVRSHALYRLARNLHNVLEGRISRAFLRAARKFGASEGPREPIGPELRRRLQLEFQPDIAELSDLLSTDLSIWGDAEIVRPPAS